MIQYDRYAFFFLKKEQIPDFWDRVSLYIPNWNGTHKDPPDCGPKCWGQKCAMPHLYSPEKFKVNWTHRKDEDRLPKTRPTLLGAPRPWLLDLIPESGSSFDKTLRRRVQKAHPGSRKCYTKQLTLPPPLGNTWMGKTLDVSINKLMIRSIEKKKSHEKYSVFKQAPWYK